MIRVCGVEDVPAGEGRAVTIDGCRIALFNAADGWFALDAVCPHKAGPLEDGILADRAVICPFHERRFDLASGAALTDGEGVNAYPVEVRDGEVFLSTRAIQTA